MVSDNYSCIHRIKYTAPFSAIEKIGCSLAPLEENAMLLTVEIFRVLDHYLVFRHRC